MGFCFSFYCSAMAMRTLSFSLDMKILNCFRDSHGISFGCGCKEKKDCEKASHILIQMKIISK